MVAILSEDGHTFEAGDEAYDYYSMKPGKIGDETTFNYAPDLWFTFIHTDGTQTTLNGQRICSLAHARRMGWPM